MRIQQSSDDLANRKESINALASLISEIRVGMLTTKSDDAAMRSRPMLTAKTTFDGDLWFFTDQDDMKVSEIESHQHVAISYADPQNEQYVSVSGTAEIVDDPTRKELLWETAFDRWFPDGRDSVILVRVTVHDGEYWDLHRNVMFQLGRWIKGMVSDNQPNELEHETVSLNGEPR